MKNVPGSPVSHAPWMILSKISRAFSFRTCQHGLGVVQHYNEWAGSVWHLPTRAGRRENEKGENDEFQEEDKGPLRFFHTPASLA